MKSFLLCYILIGCIFSMYIKWGIDTIGIDSVMEQLDEKPKDFGEIYEAEGKNGIIKAMKTAQQFTEIEMLI